MSVPGVVSTDFGRSSSAISPTKQVFLQAVYDCHGSIIMTDCGQFWPIKLLQPLRIPELCEHDIVILSGPLLTKKVKGLHKVKGDNYLTS